MAYDWILHEILGDIDDIAPPIYSKTLPGIPVIDEPMLSKAGHMADSLCAQLETDALIAELCPLPEPTADVDRFVREFEKATQPDFLRNILDKGKQRIARRASISADDVRRSWDIDALVDQWADDNDVDTNFDDTQDALYRVKRSMARAANEFVMEAAL